MRTRHTVLGSPLPCRVPSPSTRSTCPPGPHQGLVIPSWVHLVTWVRPDVFDTVRGRGLSTDPYPGVSLPTVLPNVLSTRGQDTPSIGTREGWVTRGPRSRRMPSSTPSGDSLLVYTGEETSSTINVFSKIRGTGDLRTQTNDESVKWDGRVYRYPLRPRRHRS